MRWLLLLPLAACTPHVERCLTFPLPPECTQGGGGGLSLLAGGDVPPKPEPGPAPAPEPQPEPKPEPPKPDPTPPGPEPEPPKPERETIFTWAKRWEAEFDARVKCNF